jgi:hypothetical protein
VLFSIRTVTAAEPIPNAEATEVINPKFLLGYDE